MKTYAELVDEMDENAVPFISVKLFNAVIGADKKFKSMKVAYNCFVDAWKKARAA